MMDAPRTTQGDLDAIRAIMIGFFVALDAFDDERALSLLSDDVQWVRESGTISGRDGVRANLASRSRSRVTRHLVANLEIRRFGQDTARARCDVVIYQSDLNACSGYPASIKGASILLSTEDELRKCAGDWKIIRKQPATIFKIDD